MNPTLRPEEKYTPFDGNITITLTDAAGEPVALSSLDDVEVHLFLNGALKLKYKKVAATGWKAWTDAEAEDDNQLHCPVTVTETAAWRGLVNSVTITVKDSKRAEPALKVEFIAKKSGV